MEEKRKTSAVAANALSDYAYVFMTFATTGLHESSFSDSRYFRETAGVVITH
jgi:hypothetical protein